MCGTDRVCSEVSLLNLREAYARPGKNHNSNTKRMKDVTKVFQVLVFAIESIRAKNTKSTCVALSSFSAMQAFPHDILYFCQSSTINHIF